MLDKEFSFPPYVTIECEYKGRSEDKEEVIAKFKQELKDRFNCPVIDYDPVKEKAEKEAKHRWRAFSNHMHECWFKVKIPDCIEEEK